MTYWKTCKLSDVVDLISGFAYKSSDWKESGVPVLKITNVRNGRVRLEGCSFITKNLADETINFQIKKGDLLITLTGEIGATGFYSEDFEARLNQRVGKIIPKSTEDVNLKYVAFFLESPLAREIMWSTAKGIAQANISPKEVLGLDIPLPSIDEQHEIVEILEGHLSRLDAASLDVKQARIKASQFRASVLNSIFFDSGSKGWPLYKASDLGKWITGSTPSSKVPDYVGTDVPFITPGDIIDGGEIANYSRMISNSGADSVRRLRSNAVHLVCIGATLGKVGVTRFESTSNQQINALEANEEIVLPDFAMWLLASPAMQRELWDASSSTTVPILNKGKLEKIDFRVPALSEQIRALEEYDRARLTLEHLKEDFEIMLEKSNGLRRSILQAAFTGQLTKEVVSV